MLKSKMVLLTALLIIGLATLGVGFYAAKIIVAPQKAEATLFIPCTSDATCNTGEICISGTCQAPTYCFTPNGYCYDGRSCLCDGNNVCTCQWPSYSPPPPPPPGSCYSENDCPTGQNCINGSCVSCGGCLFGMPGGCPAACQGQTCGECNHVTCQDVWGVQVCGCQDPGSECGLIFGSCNNNKCEILPSESSTFPTPYPTMPYYGP